MNQMKSLKSNVLFYILITSPVFFYIVSLMEPVGDDLTYFTASYSGSVWKGLLPMYSWWRPFDALLGHTVYLYPGLFPLLNHLIVCSFHLLSTVLFFQIIRRLDFKPFEQNIATFFFISPRVFLVPSSIRMLSIRPVPYSLICWDSISMLLRARVMLSVGCCSPS